MRLRVVRLLPDAVEASVFVKAGDTGRNTFTAHKYVGGEGTFQSYYVLWQGTSVSKAYDRIIHFF